MRHRKSGVKLNRTSSHRDAMFRNMVTSLFKHERIKTTDVKAKEVRRWADKLITLAKRGDLHARRQAMSIIREKAVVHKLFEEAPKKFGAVAGGYTRVVKLGFRAGDAAPVSLVEFVIPEEKPKKKKSAKKKSTAAKAAKKQVQKATPEAAPAEEKAEAAEEPAAVSDGFAEQEAVDETDTAAAAEEEAPQVAKPSKQDETPPAAEKAPAEEAEAEKKEDK